MRFRFLQCLAGFWVKMAFSILSSSFRINLSTTFPALKNSNTTVLLSLFFHCSLLLSTISLKTISIVFWIISLYSLPYLTSLPTNIYPPKIFSISPFFVFNRCRTKRDPRLIIALYFCITPWFLPLSSDFHSVPHFSDYFQELLLLPPSRPALFERYS